MAAPPDNGFSRRDVYNVTRLNREVRAVLEGSFPPLWVEGEISNLAQPASGHLYFSLKDDVSQVRCAMFQNRKRAMQFKPENGMSVLVRAGISLYETRGEYQLIVEYMEPAGVGDLQRAFEELKQRLHREGLFDEQHKKPLPPMAMRIGVITSPTGAAIRDILTVLSRRFPLARIIVYPTAVQGEGAAEQILAMLQTAAQRKECDILILTRGGGSLEDLWAFNNEKLARAIFNCAIPVVTGIGHEIDFTIADFVADRRAATPSAAAELVSPDQQQLLRLLERQQVFLTRQLNHVLKRWSERLLYLRRRMPAPLYLLRQLTQRLDDCHLRTRRALKAALDQQKGRLSQLSALLGGQNPARLLKHNMERCSQIDQTLLRVIRMRLKNSAEKIKYLAHNLNTVSPLNTLGRGYAIVQQQDGSLVRKAGQLITGEQILARFGEGCAELTVDAVLPEK
jgi:exodeoxyribonuclease VII large subunit